MGGDSEGEGYSGEREGRTRQGREGGQGQDGVSQRSQRGGGGSGNGRVDTFSNLFEFGVIFERHGMRLG